MNVKYLGILEPCILSLSIPTIFFYTGFYSSKEGHTGQ